MSQSGLNLLRIVLSSYFIALSLGLIQGTNVTLLLRPYMAPDIADFAANTGIFLAAYFVLMGMWLRPAALILAGYFLASSAFATFLVHPPAQMGDFWRDTALVAGLMMTYLQTDSRSAKRTALVRHQKAPRRVKPGDRVQPRRVVLMKTHESVTPRPALVAPRDRAKVVQISAA